MKSFFAPVLFALFAFLAVSLQAQTNPSIKIPPRKPILKKDPIIKPKLFLSKDIVMQSFNINPRNASVRGSGRNKIYATPFRIVLKNKGFANTGMFYLCTYVSDYSHPHSGDGWWARETSIKEKVRIVRASGKDVSRKNFNTLKINNMKGGETIIITGTIDIKHKYINHYHVTAAADSNNSADSYYSSHGRVKETDEFNNKKGVIPRR